MPLLGERQWFTSLNERADDAPAKRKTVKIGQGVAVYNVHTKYPILLV